MGTPVVSYAPRPMCAKVQSPSIMMDDYLDVSKLFALISSQRKTDWERKTKSRETKV